MTPVSDPAATSVVEFSGRAGGVSTGRFTQANISTRVGDDPGAVLQNRRLLMRRLGLTGRPLFTVRQHHSAAVVEVSAADAAGAVPELCGLDVRADGMVTRDPGVALMVGVADCVPVVLVDAAHAVVCVVHAGWRGIVAGVVQRGVAAMRDSGARPASMSGVVGPSIGGCCYPVGETVRNEVLDRFPSAAAWTREGRPSVELRAAVTGALCAAGVGDVVVRGGCTSHERDRYFSARRDGATGCQAAIVALRPAS